MIDTNMGGGAQKERGKRILLLGTRLLFDEAGPAT